MLILALETSQTAGSVALLDGETVIRERKLSEDSRSARTLAPGIAALLNDSRIEPNALQLIAVARGPGSFTGLRIGVTTAKTLAWSLGIPLVAVETMDVLTEQALSEAIPGTTIRVAIDAFRKEVFAADFQVDQSDRFNRIGPTRLETLEDWLAGCSVGTLANGPIVTRVLDKFPDGARIAEVGAREPLAEFVGRLAYRAFLAGQRDDPFQLTPLYLRPSYAEEVRATKSPS